MSQFSLKFELSDTGILEVFTVVLASSPLSHKITLSIC